MILGFVKGAYKVVDVPIVVGVSGPPTKLPPPPNREVGVSDGTATEGLGLGPGLAQGQGLAPTQGQGLLVEGVS